jgi:hypothetical protein
MNYVGKMDVIDLIIETLREHEKALNDIVSKLDVLLNQDENQKTDRKDTNKSTLENWR